MDGINIDPNILIQTQNSFLAQARIKEVQLEAAVQQLAMENQRLQMEVERLTAATADVEVEGASADHE